MVKNNKTSKVWSGFKKLTKEETIVSNRYGNAVARAAVAGLNKIK